MKNKAIVQGKYLKLIIDGRTISVPLPEDILEKRVVLN